MYVEIVDHMQACQRRASDSLEMELQMVVSGIVCGGSRTLSSERIARVFNC